MWQVPAALCMRWPVCSSLEYCCGCMLLCLSTTGTLGAGCVDAETAYDTLGMHLCVVMCGVLVRMCVQDRGDLWLYRTHRKMLVMAVVRQAATNFQHVAVAVVVFCDHVPSRNPVYTTLRHCTVCEEVLAGHGSSCFCTPAAAVGRQVRWLFVQCSTPVVHTSVVSVSGAHAKVAGSVALVFVVTSMHGVPFGQHPGALFPGYKWWWCIPHAAQLHTFHSHDTCIPGIFVLGGGPQEHQRFEAACIGTTTQGNGHVTQEGRPPGVPLPSCAAAAGCLGVPSQATSRHVDRAGTATSCAGMCHVELSVGLD